MEAMPPALLRLKGFCATTQGPALLQMVGPRWTLTPEPAEGIALVGIGTPELLDLAAALDAALA